MASEVALVMAIPVRREDERIEQTYIFFGTSSYDFCPYFTGKNLVAWSYLTATRVGMTDDLKYLVCISFCLSTRICVGSMPRGGNVQ